MLLVVLLYFSILQIFILLSLTDGALLTAYACLPAASFSILLALLTRSRFLYIVLYYALCRFVGCVLGVFH